MFKEGDKIRVTSVEGSLLSFPSLYNAVGVVHDYRNKGTVFIKLLYKGRICIFIVCEHEIELI